MLLMKCSTPPSGSWRSATWTASPIYCGTSARALRRIEDGSFGVCLHCEEDISPKRLAAVPWAAFCIQCQEIADRSQVDNAGNLDELLVNAA